jgi:hypothetical protein
MSEFADAGVCDGLGQGERAGLFSVRDENALVMQKIDGHFGHHNFHDSFTVAGAGHAAGFGIGVATATDERRIADASWKFAACSAGGSTRSKISMAINGDGAHGALFVAHMMFGCVGIFQAALPGYTFARVNEFFRVAERGAVFHREFFSARGDQHHVLTFFEDQTRETNRIAHVFDGGNGASFQGLAVHYDCVELNVAVAI